MNCCSAFGGGCVLVGVGRRIIDAGGLPAVGTGVKDWRLKTEEEKVSNLSCLK